MKNKRKFEEHTLELAIQNRRTIREITGKKISSKYLETLVWAAFGTTLSYYGDKYRPAPSAGGLYPIELYVFVERVDEYKDGIYLFDTKNDRLKLSTPGIFLPDVERLALDQEFISRSNAVFITVYNPKRIERKYGRKSRDYALLECGHIAQNILLAAAALDLGSVPVGAFYEKRLANLLSLKPGKKPFYMICVGTID